MWTIEEKSERRRMDRRVVICAAFLTLPLCILGLRLWQVQVLDGTSHRRKVSWQSVRTVRQNPVRGRIMSADGQLLVGNRSVYDVVFHPAEMRQPGPRRKTVEHILACARRLSTWIGRPSLVTEARLKRHLYQRPAMPLDVFRSLDEWELCRIWELEPWIRGLDIETREVRDYPVPGMLSHVLGFTGSTRPAGEFDGTEFSRSYVTVDMGGRSGLELSYDRELSGSAGVRLVRVDPVGYVYDEVPGGLPATDGHHLILSIDSRAQSLGESIMEGLRGALVFMDVKDGGVLAMVSKPGFSLRELTGKRYAEMNQDKENMPLLNRAIDAQYTPGSIVKPLVGLAALECGAIDTEWRHNCIGYYAIGNHRIHCARRSGHGQVDIYDAITVSCNPFFMVAGLKTTLKHLAPMFAAAGFGEKTGIDIPEFGRGLCPSEDVARKRLGRGWLKVDTAYCSMGQGLILVTPLQMAVYCAALANGGDLLRPYLVQEIREDSGRVIRRAMRSVRRHLPVSDYNLSVIRRAMSNAVESSIGSGRMLQKVTVPDPETGALQRVPLASKTGTAEVGSGATRRKETWMIVYGPLPEPRYAFAAVVERGDSGSKTVGPIALEFWTRWMRTVAAEASAVK